MVMKTEFTHQNQSEQASSAASRRAFLKASAIGAAAASSLAFPAVVSARGVNETLKIGLIGWKIVLTKKVLKLIVSLSTSGAKIGGFITSFGFFQGSQGYIYFLFL